MPAPTVQHAMRQWLEGWGRPEHIQFDHGQPWCSNPRALPSLFELWLVGLGIDVVWSRLHHPQDNGIVERSHRTTQAWSAPQHCQSLAQLQRSVDHSVQVQRQYYADKEGLTRLQRHPQLMHVRRPYRINQEDQLWQLQRVYDHLATGCWPRKVDASGRISLYSHNYTVSRAYAQQTLWIRFDPNTGQWTCSDADGVLVKQFPALEITDHTIRNLQLPHSCTRSALQFAQANADDAPPS